MEGRKREYEINERGVIVEKGMKGDDDDIGQRRRS
jgi:hypothetical protein